MRQGRTSPRGSWRPTPAPCWPSHRPAGWSTSRGHGALSRGRTRSRYRPPARPPLSDLSYPAVSSWLKSVDQRSAEPQGVVVNSTPLPTLSAPHSFRAQPGPSPVRIPNATTRARETTSLDDARLNPGRATRRGRLRHLKVVSAVVSKQGRQRPLLDAQSSSTSLLNT